MSDLQSLIASQEPRAALRNIGRYDFLLTGRTPNGAAVGPRILRLLLEVFGSIPKLDQRDAALGGLSCIEMRLAEGREAQWPRSRTSSSEYTSTSMGSGMPRRERLSRTIFFR